MKPDEIPAPAVRRLSLYLRQLEEFLQQDKHTTSSRELGEALGFTDAQVRKDFAYFGQFGQPGIGYRIEDLVTRVRHILGTDKTWNVILVGAGHLGSALAAYRGFEKKGFRIVGVFDNDPRLTGTVLNAEGGLRVAGMSDVAAVVREHGVLLAIIAVPAAVAQEVADFLVSVGIMGVLNFAPVSLNVGREVAVGDVDLAVHLEQLSFQISAAMNSARLPG